MLPGPSAVVCLADSESQLAQIRNQANVATRLNILVNDTSQSYGIVHAPTHSDAKRILAFFKANTRLPYFVAQCQVGVGGQAVIAALVKINGGDPADIFKNGTYNRQLYHRMLEAADVAPDPEPLVSLVVRVKYSPDRLLLFLLSIRRQRYENWEVVAVTDGPNPDALALVERFDDPRVRIIETGKAAGTVGSSPTGKWELMLAEENLSACPTMTTITCRDILSRCSYR